jgi:hypothetical protein
MVTPLLPFLYIFLHFINVENIDLLYEFMTKTKELPFFVQKLDIHTLFDVGQIRASH